VTSFELKLLCSLMPSQVEAILIRQRSLLMPAS